MRKDSRLSRVLHILTHLAISEEPMTSAQIAAILSTNPVVVRRIMGMLRECGYVDVTKGRSGGWSLACSLSDVTLLDIHNLLGETSLFTIGLTDEHSNCAIEKAVNAELEAVMNEAEALVLARFGEISLNILSEQRR